MNLERDTALLLDLAKNSKRIGIFSIGGGVPRNNTQNVAPLIEIINNRLKADIPERKFFYGCRIDPTPLWYGNLSGCTYSEGGSWRKMDFNGKFAEVHADATIVWPFIQKFAMKH
jgi:deoxyhypusine synthase